ncbi:MAG: prepilin-type N-terminal cleavage/methylation domain-containing protein [bacterium]|nr:prepilin-type N-terminal cleavage/methylation domain-containing protein [bacterium]
MNCRTSKVDTKRGFSLIELLIAVSIILVLTTAAVASYNTFHDRQRLREAGLTLKANLRSAQNRAQSGEKPTAGCTTLDGYKVTFTAVNYTIQADCIGFGFGSPPAMIITLPSGITFSPVPSDLVFKILGQGASLSAPVTLSLILTGFSTTYQISVSPSGDINDLGFYTGS